MKFLVCLLVTVAAASASIYGGKTVNVLDDGTILIRTDSGKQMMISKQMGPLGQKMVEIEVNGPTGMGKKILINDENQVKVIPEMMNYKIAPRMMFDDMDEMMRYKRSKMPVPTQADMMGEIMKEFQGIVDEASFEKLLSKVEKSVMKGKLSPEFLEQLKMMAEQQPWGQTGVMDHGVQTPMMNKWGMMGQNMWQTPVMGQNMWQTPMMGQNMWQTPMMGQNMWQTPVMGQNMWQTPMMGQQMMNKQWPMTTMNKNIMGEDMWKNQMGVPTTQSVPWVQRSMGMSPVMGQRMVMTEPTMDKMTMKDLAAVNMMKWNPWMKANWQAIPFTRMWMNNYADNVMA